MVDEIFREVDDELRAERIRRLARRFAGLGLGIVVLAGAGAGGWEYYRSTQQARAEQASLTYFKALHDAGMDESASGASAPLTGVQKKGLASLTQLSGVAPAGLATLSKLRVAAASAAHGDVQSALTTWNSIAADRQADRNLRDLATLLWCQWQIDSGDVATVRSRLSLLTDNGKPYAALANEALATLDIREGQDKSARGRLTRLTQDFAAPEGVRMRANALLQTLGQAG
ncbi:tetratricopeptide repeat protein [Acetobacter oeni]|uniref:tetratricopeptide repeat protein n=1 Tax=Acetobacter oeni TaxID=304077 RepID=UPI0011BF774C|nr:tetratricopeptide repeat protein [Acetobacter oeni]MBB3883846.1 hypothetical protein [Acetobacter oeni]NHO19773.1 tetratricopeptide repeat protein [Acetobacter oeni]